MGFHTCEYCVDKGIEPRFGHLSSGDVNLTFTNGDRWVMPDMILHYVADHNWPPPQKFIEDVMTGELAQCDRQQTRGMTLTAIFENRNKIYEAVKVGYLSGSLTTGPVPEGFVEKLEELMKKAGAMGLRAQTKGFKNDNLRSHQG